VRGISIEDFGGIAMADDGPITLRDACELYPKARLTVSTLRAEASRGRLDIFRLGKRDYTTAQAMREMVRKCQDEDPRRGSISTQDVTNGLSETAHASSARAALNQTVTALKRGLPHISGKNTRHNRDLSH
jgi:hypothetical protein